MEWKTRVTELLGCKYPIMEGSLARNSDWKLAAAVAKAGAFGQITAHSVSTPEELRESIKKCRDATDQPFGVNLTYGRIQQIEKWLEVCIEERVPVETSGYKPDSLAKRIKEGKVPWINKSARVKDAIHAEELGADAVIVVGLEGSGFKSPEELPTFTNIAYAKRLIKIPFIAAGGIGDARTFLGAMAMGADGIMMATAFMATHECAISQARKEAIIKAKPDDAEFLRYVLSPGDPQALAEVMKQRAQVPLDKFLSMLQAARAKGLSQDLPHEIREISLTMAVMDRIQSVKELIDGIVQGAEELLDSYQFLKTR